MRVLLLGATGRTGKIVLHLLMERHEQVTTLGRRAVEVTGARSLVGDPMDRDTLEGALQGQEAVINCLLSIGDPPLCSTIAGHVASHHPQLRYLTIGGAGVAIPGDNKGIAGLLVGAALKLMQPKMLADRQGEADILRASSVRWTMLRPPRLTDAPATGEWTFTFDRPAKLSIGRPDLARATVEALYRDDLVGKAPFVSAA